MSFISRLPLLPAIRSAAVILGASAIQLGLAGDCFGSYLADLAGYYQFNGNGDDSSGNSRDLTLVGNPGFASGVFGQALSLYKDGSQFAQRPVSDPAFNFGSSNFTVQAWVNYNSTDTEQILVEKWSGAQGPGWTLTKMSNNAFRLDTGLGNVAVDTPVEAITTSSWHQIIAGRSGSTLSIYYDGILAATQSFIGSIGTNTNPLLIGRRDGDDLRDFSLNGRLDEIAIWNRALSNSEIAGLWNDGKGLNLLPASVPEPSSVALLAIGAACLIGLKLHRPWLKSSLGA